MKLTSPPKSTTKNIAVNPEADPGFPDGGCQPIILAIFLHETGKLDWEGGIHP